ncbi:actin-histidine N-methyltransferase isoform X2 [Eurosta solidaginis]|uniref:actin-histidine N-methyltransferase isoform X2 n=1 Tax=Eurosta solidaginis TaxID=178769 RepID=UPI00353113AE
MGKNHRNKNKSNSNKNQTRAANVSAHADEVESSKQQQQQSPSKRPTLMLQKRNELSALIKTLFEICFQQATNPKEEWDQYTEIQSLLHRVQILEAPLQRSTSKQSIAARLANIENFYSWVSANCLRYDGVRIAQFPGYELGLEATRDIAEDELLFSIPRKLILTEENLDLEASPAQFGSMSNLKLSYVLMLEALKPDSFWKPYIDLLPEKYNTVLYFTSKEMEMLRGSNALTAALRQCKAIARQYAFLYNYTVQAPRAHKFNPMGQAFKEQFSYELYRFVNPDNPKDYVCIKLGLGNSDPLFTQRAKLLEMMQILKNTELRVLPPPTFISPELLAFVRVFNMNEQQLEHWISSERAMDLLHIDCALETTLESKTWQYLQTRLMLLLRVFPTTLEADEKQLAAYKKDELFLCYVEAMVLQYRILEKRILTAALDYAKQRIKV